MRIAPSQAARELRWTIGTCYRELKDIYKSCREVLTLDSIPDGYAWGSKTGPREA